MKERPASSGPGALVDTNHGPLDDQAIGLVIDRADQGGPWRGRWSTPAEIEQEAHRIFHHVLERWAMDLLALRAAGLDRPGFAEQDPGSLLVAPS